MVSLTIIHSLLLDHCAKHFNVPQNFPKKHPPERKAIKQKPFWTLFITHRQTISLSGKPTKDSMKVNTQYLEIFLNDLCSNQQHCCVQPSQMQSSALACVLQTPSHCYIIAYDDFLFKQAYTAYCASDHIGCSCHKASRRLGLLIKHFSLPKDPAHLLWVLQVPSR